MTVILISLLAAAIQMVLLLVTARILGAAEYSGFSLIMTVAIFLSACCSEWLRMILARQGSSLRHRMRTALLGGLRVWTVRLALSLLIGLAPIAILAEAIASKSIALAIVATSLVGTGTMLSDMAATFLRFTSSRQAYNCFVLLRVSLMGGASVAAAALGGNGSQTATAFGAAALLCGGGFIALFWTRSLPRKGLIIRLGPMGWSLASGSLGTNISLMLSRLALGIALPANISGGVFLAIDLATRGINVLGVAINTWGNRLIINASHYEGIAGAKRTFLPVSAVFITIWFSVALAGVALCVAIPLITLTFNEVDLYLMATVSTVFSILLLFLRTFLFDAYLSAIGRHREVAHVGVSTVFLTAIGALFAAFVPTPAIGMLAFPAAVVLSYIAYFKRNGTVLWSGINRPSAIFGVHAIFAVAVAGGVVSMSDSLPVTVVILSVITMNYGFRLSVAAKDVFLKNKYISKDFD